MFRGFFKSYGCIIVFVACHLHAFDMYQGALKLLPALNPLCWELCGLDIETEAVFLCRDNVSRRVDFTSLGQEGSIALHSDQLDFGWESGYRITGRANLEGSDAFEVIWMRNFEWKDSKRVKSDMNDLFSVFSDFGINPNGGFPETDQASLHEIDTHSRFDSLEWSYHRHLSLPIPCLDTTILYGYRRIGIEEEFKHKTVGREGKLAYATQAQNQLHGFQLGVSASLPWSSSVIVKMTGKGALYGNSTKQKTVVRADSWDGPLKERKEKMRGSWGLEGAIKLSYELCPSVHIQSSYQVLYLENVALALENFNALSPFALTRQAILAGRPQYLENDGHAAYHGISLGADFSW